MHIVKVLNYNGAWEALKNSHELRLEDLRRAVGGEYIAKKYTLFSLGLVEELTSFFLGRKWLKGRSESQLIFNNNGVEAKFAFNETEIMEYLISKLLTANNPDKTRIIIIPALNLTENKPRKSLKLCEYIQARRAVIKAIRLGLKPSVALIGFGHHKHSKIEIELPETSTNDFKNEIDRSIEFPPEYHQAGLSILNYFGTYLREQYPEHKARVRIEQEGLLVRLKIETEDGRTDIVEKALYEYHLIVTGKAPPEEFISDPLLILGLKNKLEMAGMELRWQQNLIGMQNEKIDKLLTIIGNGLASAGTIDIRPIINVTTNVAVTYVTQALGTINELRDLVGPSSELFSKLEELASSLETIEHEKNPEVVKKSGAMSKFKRIVESFTEGTEETKKAIKAGESGLEIVKDLARKYNSIAEWCGLPQVPRVFTK